MDTHLPSLAVIGKMGAGKTTIAEWLVAGAGYTRGSFAAKLKDIATLIWGLDALTDRDKLQRLGTAVRDIDEDAWVNLAIRQMESQRRTSPVYSRFVVDDCRFPNEYWKLKEQGFLVLRVVADEDLRVQRLEKIGKLQDRSQLHHISETALDEFDADYTVTNEGTDHELFNQLRDVLFMEVKRI